MRTELCRRITTTATPAQLWDVYVPSWGRAGAAPVLERLRDHPVAPKVHVMTRPGESARLYARTYPRYDVLEDPGLGIGPARLACLDDALRRGLPRIVMMDDDITRLSLVEDVTEEDGSTSPRRYPARADGFDDTPAFIAALAAGCLAAGRLMDRDRAIVYGALRKARFARHERPDLAATIGSGAFPACVTFWDVARCLRYQIGVPACFHHRGEDLALFLDALVKGAKAFTIRGIAYDQDEGIETTIPPDAADGRGRASDLENARRCWPMLAPYLKAAGRHGNRGGVAIGLRWRRLHQALGTAPEEFTAGDLFGD